MAGFVLIRQVESRPNLSFGRTLRLSSDRHDLIPPPLCLTLKPTAHSSTFGFPTPQIQRSNTKRA